MNKIEKISKNFILLKKHLDNSDITFLCNHSFRSITGGIQGIYKEEYSKITKSIEKDLKNNKISDKDYIKNLLINLESSKTKSDNKLNNKTKIKSHTHTPSIKDISDNSPMIINDDENHINKNEDKNNSVNINNNNIISLKEEEDENKNQLNNINSSNCDEKDNDKKKLYINIIDKIDKKMNLKENIIEKFSKFGEILSKITENVQKMMMVEIFYNEQKEKIIAVNLVDENIIDIDTIKKIIHLFFNILSKIFKFLTKETENICSLCLNNIFDVINLITDFVKNVKKFINNNGNDIKITFLNNIKIIGNYCLYVLIIKKNNYEYLKELQNQKNNNKINEFFKVYTKYLKTVNKLIINFKDNDMFIKHFMVQPTLISFVELFEMNRKIINYQLNVNFK